MRLDYANEALAIARRLLGDAAAAYPFKFVIPFAAACFCAGVVEIVRCVRCLQTVSGRRVSRIREVDVDKLKQMSMSRMRTSRLDKLVVGQEAKPGAAQ